MTNQIGSRNRKKLSKQLGISNYGSNVIKKEGTKMFFSIHKSVTADLWRLDGERGDCGSRFRVPPLQNGPYEEILYFFNTCFHQLFEPDNFCFDDIARYFVYVIVIVSVIVIVIETISKTKKLLVPSKLKLSGSKSWFLNVGPKVS